MSTKLNDQSNNKIKERRIKENNRESPGKRLDKRALSGRSNELPSRLDAKLHHRNKSVHSLLNKVHESVNKQSRFSSQSNIMILPLLSSSRYYYYHLAEMISNLGFKVKINDDVQNLSEKIKEAERADFRFILIIMGAQDGKRKILLRDRKKEIRRRLSKNEFYSYLLDNMP